MVVMTKGPIFLVFVPAKERRRKGAKYFWRWRNGARKYYTNIIFGPHVARLGRANEILWDSHNPKETR